MTSTDHSVRFNFMIIDDKDNLYMDLDVDGKVILPKVIIQNINQYLISVKREMKNFSQKENKYYKMASDKNFTLWLLVVKVKSTILSNKFVKVHISKLRHIENISNLFSMLKTDLHEI